MSMITARPCEMMRRECRSPEVKWEYRGQIYTLSEEYTHFCINSDRQVCVCKAEKYVSIYEPTGRLLLHYDFTDHTVSVMSRHDIFQDRISFALKADNRFFWFYNGRLYSSPAEDYASYRISEDRSYFFLSCEKGTFVCDPVGAVIAKNQEDRLYIRGRLASEHPINQLRILFDYRLIAILCDTEGSGYADKLLIFDHYGRRLADISAAEQGYSCIYCLDAAGLSCPCVGFLKERPHDIDYRYASGFNSIPHDIDPSWYDILYDGNEIKLKYAYGMTQIFHRHNFAENR